MKRFFYAKIALTNLKKNRQTCFPYLLTCIATIMMFYIMSSLSTNSVLNKMRGGATMGIVLMFGTVVVGIFAVLFLFYTNSFLVKRRKKEFGLYYILGMEKRHISRVMLWETIYTAILSILFGIACGILFSKLVFLGLLKILKMEVVIGVEVSAFTLAETIGLFTVIFLLIFFNSVRLIYMVRPAELLKGGQIGEKMPKTRWILALLGVMTLAGGYLLALKADNVMTGLNTFFVAVLLVIVGTFSLFTAGSIAFLKLLQKNKRYYYKTNHFISLSSMIYRMKRNGAGLASICILSTMVLVMVSSTTSLYLSMEHGLNLRYPKSVQIEMYTKPEQTEEMKENQNGQIIELVQKVLKEHNQTAENPENYRMLTVSGIVSKNEIYFNPENAPGVNEVNTFDHLKMFYALPLEAYNRIMGTNLELAPGEAYLYAKDSDFPYDQITVENSGTWRIKGHLDKMISNGNNMANMNSSFYLVVSGLEDIKALEEGNVSVYGVNGSYEKWYYNFDLSCGDEEQIQIQNEIDKKINALAEQESEESDTLFFGASTDSRAASRADYQALYGGLFFLGILLGVVFILGMVLIIYYKQITEGYEDQDRFQILMKVGMTQKEVRQTINSQVMTVFFLPLVAAGIHTAFAFPMIEKMVHLLAFSDRKFLILVTVCSYLVFALFYIIVYMVTSKQYYKIVSGKQEESLFS